MLRSEARAARPLNNTGTFLPLLALFTALDQIGNTYLNRRQHQSEKANWSGIKKALHHFSTINGDSEECKALYSLRNSLVHNDSIASRGRIDGAGNAQGPYHRFAFDDDISDIIELPNPRWDGEWGAAPYTSLNRDRLFDLVDETVQKARDLFDSGDLGIRIDHGELVDSFLMVRPRPVQVQR